MKYKKEPKYKIGDKYYMKKLISSLFYNDEVIIASVHKKGRHTKVDVYDINRRLHCGISVKALRKKRR